MSFCSCCFPNASHKPAHGQRKTQVLILWLSRTYCIYCTSVHPFDPYLSSEKLSLYNSYHWCCFFFFWPFIPAVLDVVVWFCFASVILVFLFVFVCFLGHAAALSYDHNNWQLLVVQSICPLSPTKKHLIIWTATPIARVISFPRIQLVFLVWTV